MSKFAYVALSCAAMSLVVSASAMAQDPAITSGGDVTADEVTPLPPVVVEAPTYLGAIMAFRGYEAAITAVPMDDHGLEVDEAALTASRCR